MSIKSCVIVAAFAMTPMFAWQATGSPAPPAQGELTRAQQRAKAKAQNVPEIPYEAVPNFIKMPPNLYLGEGIGVATNSKGHVFAYTRSQDTRLFEFDQTGKFLREI